MSNITKLPAIRLGIREIDLCAWLGQAVPGDILEYHRGFLALDGAPQASRLDDMARRELVRVGQRAFWAAEQGIVHLVQRRCGPDDFSYLAIARPRPKKAHAALSSLMLMEAA